MVATLGPAAGTRQHLAELIEAGMNVAQMNFSHGSYDEYAERIELVRSTAAQAGRGIAIPQNHQGPKIPTWPGWPFNSSRCAISRDDGAGMRRNSSSIDFWTQLWHLRTPRGAPSPGNPGFTGVLQGATSP